MPQETLIEGVRSFLNRKGINEEVLVEELRTVRPYKGSKLGFPFENLRLMENPEFWPQGAIKRPFLISYRTWRQHRGASVEADM
jgi:hypothetical protein